MSRVCSVLTSLAHTINGVWSSQTCSTRTTQSIWQFQQHEMRVDADPNPAHVALLFIVRMPFQPPWHTHTHTHTHTNTHTNTNTLFVPSNGMFLACIWRRIAESNLWWINAQHQFWHEHTLIQVNDLARCRQLVSVWGIQVRAGCCACCVCAPVWYLCGFRSVQIRPFRCRPRQHRCVLSRPWLCACLELLWIQVCLKEPSQLSRS